MKNRHQTLHHQPIISTPNPRTSSSIRVYTHDPLLPPTHRSKVPTKEIQRHITADNNIINDASSASWLRLLLWSLLPLWLLVWRSSGGGIMFAWGGRMGRRVGIVIIDLCVWALLLVCLRMALDWSWRIYHIEETRRWGVGNVVLYSRISVGGGADDINNNAKRKYSTPFI